MTARHTFWASWMMLGCASATSTEGPFAATERPAEVQPLPPPQHSSAARESSSNASASQGVTSGGPATIHRATPQAPLELSPQTLVWPQEIACGSFECFVFERADQAVATIILQEKARFIGFGEAHTPAEYRGPSTVERFTRQIFPALAAGASHLVVELLAPPKEGCESQTQQAKKESQQITEGQSKSNQNHYQALGATAAQQGVVPDILRASCADMAAIASPEGGVLTYMETIARLFERELSARGNQTKKNRPLVLAYGGALHNDLMPRAGREGWSYAPGLKKRTGAAYVEVDLIVPELIRPTDSWKSFPWYESYLNQHHASGTLVLRAGPQSYVVFFPPDPDASPESNPRTTTPSGGLSQ